MSNEYKWARNLMKLNRAIAESKGEGEAVVKQLYISYGGLLDKDYEKVGEIAQTLAEEVMSEPELTTKPEIADNVAIEEAMSSDFITEEVVPKKKTKKNAK